VNQILFGVIATAGVLAALGTVLARNLVHAALFLVAFFFLVACQFVMLEAEFLAAVQVLVYIGAVAIIMMFGIMLTRNIQGDDTTKVSRAGFFAAGLAAVGMLAVLVIGINREEGPLGQTPWRELTTRPAIGPDKDLKATPRAQAINNMGHVVGGQLLSRYLVAFEVAGILLTAALVGAIALAVQEESHEDDDPSARVRDREEAGPPAPSSSVPESTLTGAGA
jgi:NADH:ubiquinone oxidoreductase subunit 6 (subunit J)